MLMLAQNSGEFCYLNLPGRLLERGNPNLAEGDPLSIFLKSFYNNEVGKEAHEARAGSLAPLDTQREKFMLNRRYLSRGRDPFLRARSRSGHKIAKDYEIYGSVLLFMPKTDVLE